MTSNNVVSVTYDTLLLLYVWSYIHTCMYSHTYSKNVDQPGRVANPARGQLNTKNEYFPVRVRV